MKLRGLRASVGLLLDGSLAPLLPRVEAQSRSLRQPPARARAVCREALLRVRLGQTAVRFSGC